MSDTPAPRHLGRPSALPASPEAAELDYVPNPRPGALYLVRFAAPEFTSLCPVTGQPDFAHLVIDYAPGETIVESKSLKLFLASFRNHCGFHEDVTVGIGQRLADEMRPRWLRIGGYWYPASRSTCFGRALHLPRGCGCPIRALRLTVGAGRAGGQRSRAAAAIRSQSDNRGERCASS
jgi:7-cyano-7-deazaguanine reductase